MSKMGFRFETGDAVEIDGVLHEIVRQDRDGITLRVAGQDRRFRTLTNDEFWELYHADATDGPRKLKVVRGLFGTLPVAVLDNLDSVFEAFDPRWREDALKRLDYVQTADRVFAADKSRRRKRYPKRPEGYARVAKLVAWMRRRRAALLAKKPAVSMPLEVVGGSTLRDWCRRWRNSGRNMLAIMPCHDAKGRAGSRLNGDVVQIVGRWIRDRYMTLERPDATVVYDGMAGEIESMNATRIQPLSVPSYATFRRCIKQWTTPYDRVLAREGKGAAEQKFRHVRRAAQPTLPLEIVEIDHTLLDVVLTDDDGRRSRGDGRKKEVYKVWMTIARCQATKVIFGWYFSREAPSWTSVMACLNMGVQPKCLDGVVVRSPYPVFGVPAVLKMDNGAEFHSLSLKAVAGQLGIELRYMPRGKGHMKGGIERTIGTISREFLAFLPGRTFSNPQVRGDYDSEGRAAVSLKKLEEMFTTYVVDVLHNRPMGSLLGLTPLQTWESLSQVGVRMPPDPKDLDVILSLVIDRTVTNVGVTFLGLTFQSKELQTVRKTRGHLGKNLMVKVDPHDLGQVLVLDEGDEQTKPRWVCAPCTCPELGDGVSVVEWKETVALARQRTEQGRRVALSTLRQARKLLAEQAARLGSKPMKVRPADIDWYRDHADDVQFEIDPLDGDDAKPSRPGRGRPRKAVAALPALGVGNGGHVPAECPEANTPAETPRPAQDFSDPSTWDDEPAGPPAEGQAPAPDYDDPANWDD